MKPGKGKKTNVHEGKDTTHFTVIDDERHRRQRHQHDQRHLGHRADGAQLRVHAEQSDAQLQRHARGHHGQTPPPTTSSRASARARRSRRPWCSSATSFMAAYGSPGGTGILNAILQVTLNLDRPQPDPQERRWSSRGSRSTAGPARRTRRSRRASPPRCGRACRTWATGFDNVTLDRRGAGHRHLPRHRRLAGRPAAVRRRRFAPDRRRAGARRALSDCCIRAVSTRGRMLPPPFTAWVASLLRRQDRRRRSSVNASTSQTRAEPRIADRARTRGRPRRLLRQAVAGPASCGGSVFVASASASTESGTSFTGRLRIVQFPVGAQRRTPPSRRKDRPRQRRSHPSSWRRPGSRRRHRSGRGPVTRRPRRSDTAPRACSANRSCRAPK